MGSAHCCIALAWVGRGAIEAGAHPTSLESPWFYDAQVLRAEDLGE
jgi:hypothetical protein